MTTSFERPIAPLLRTVAIMLFCGVFSSSGAQENPAFGPAMRQTARLPVVRASHGMVVSKESHATHVGVDILRQGGNAIDAAVAVGFALAVTSPRSAALGGGGFMLVYLAKEKRTVALDYREVAPSALSRDAFLDSSGQPDGRLSRDTGLAVGVPGTVAGLAYAHAHWGSGRLSLEQLVAPAIALARDGVPVADDLEDSLAQDAGRIGKFPETRKIFLHADGLPLALGDRLIQTDLANTLRAIGLGGPSAFYNGPIADAIASSVRGIGGRMSADDLATYKVVEREPLRGTYRGHEVVSMPPPSSGGALVIEILNLLEAFPIGTFGANSAAEIHVMAEAMKLAYADRSEWLADPDFYTVPARGLISKSYADDRRKQISPERALSANEIAPGRPQPYESSQTTHFSVVDEEGNAVANTYTLNLSFGVGMVATGTGVVLNNEMDDFTAKPGASNTYGLVGQGLNLPEGGKRPLSSMSPTLVFKDGHLEFVLGSPGGSRIITTVVEILINLIDHGYNVTDAVDLPRFHHQWRPDQLLMERGVSPDTIALLQAKGQTIRVQDGWGSAAVIGRTNAGLLTGSADPRQRGSLADGF